MTNDQNPYQLNDNDHQEISELLESTLLDPVQSVENPEAFIIGGQPGSGKGQLAAFGVQYFEKRGDCVLIDVDNIRSFHPHYATLLEHDDKKAAAFTHEDTSKWAKNILVKAVQKQLNVVLDQVSDEYTKLTEKIDIFRHYGYNYIQLNMMAVNPIVSRVGTLLRYEELKKKGEGRFVPYSVHERYKNIPDCLEKIGKKHESKSFNYV